MISPDDYLQSLRRLQKRKIYYLGNLIDDPVGHPAFRPALNAVALTYELAANPELASLATATSALSGRRINRFCHLHQDRDDLIKKVQLQRLLGQKTGSCFQRCVGWDAVNALFSVTYEIDQTLGRGYHENLRKYLRQWEDNDWTVAGSMTDPKGHRGLAPHSQVDPDVYLHVVERRADGIIVRGAKAHQTGILNAHELIAMPTLACGPKDEAFAVAFALPTDADGLTYICGRQSCDTRKLESPGTDTGNLHYGGQEALVIFEDVFVPRERVFLCGEWEFTGRLVERFAGYHRQSYGGCKAGMGDVLIGAASALVQCQGVAKASHIRDKLAEMVHLNESLFSCGIACSALGHKTTAGNYLIDLLLANVCKLNVTRFPFEIARLAQDLAGGLLATLPAAADFLSPETGPMLAKYLAGADAHSAGERQRLLRLIEAMTLGANAACYLTESMHGAGSPQAQKIMIERLAGLAAKEELAKSLIKPK